MHNGNNHAEIRRGNEAVRTEEAIRLRRRLIARKTAVTQDVNNCKKKLELKMQQTSYRVTRVQKLDFVL